MEQKSLKDIFQGYVEKRMVFKNKDVLTDRYIPEHIVHREKHINQIAKTLAPSLRGEKVSNLFIYGSVGTGKSVSVKSVAKELEKTSDKVKILYINCKMKKISNTEYRLLAELSRALGKEVPATGLPTDHVYKIFFEALDSKSQSVILVLDEIDALVKKTGDEILYNLTRINQDLSNAKLSIIGISNDVSFIENIDARVKSSLSEEEIIFSPYDANQLRDILTQRSNLAFNPNTLEDGVIALCAALAAQEHGDARRALDLLRMAGEMVEREGGNKINKEHIDRAEDKLDLDRIVTVVGSQPKQSKAVLAAIIKLVDDNHKKFQTGDIYSVYEKICANNGLKVLTQRRVSDLIAELDMLGIINARVISKGRYGRTKEVRVLLSDSILNKIKRILKESYLIG